MIADVFDPAKGQRAGGAYIIARAEFLRTYRLVRGAARENVASEAENEQAVDSP